MSAGKQSSNIYFLDEALERGFGYAQAVIYDGLIYISGTLSINSDMSVVGEGDMGVQLKTIYERIARSLSANGADITDILKETVFVTDMDAMLGANSVRLQVFGEHMPACTVVEVNRLAFPGCMAEIEVIAKQSA